MSIVQRISSTSLPGTATSGLSSHFGDSESDCWENLEEYEERLLKIWLPKSEIIYRLYSLYRTTGSHCTATEKLSCHCVKRWNTVWETVTHWHWESYKIILDDYELSLLIMILSITVINIIIIIIIRYIIFI